MAQSWTSPNAHQPPSTAALLFLSPSPPAPRFAPHNPCLFFSLHLELAARFCRSFYTRSRTHLLTRWFTHSCALPPSGQDIPEDVAGGLHLATGLDWRGDIRLCILIADAPCHGSAYHRWIADNYPKGCPKGRDPCKLLYTLQVITGGMLETQRVFRYEMHLLKVAML